MHLSRKIALAGIAAALVATPTLAQAASTTLASQASHAKSLPLLASRTDQLLLPLGGELLPSMTFDSRDLDAVVRPPAASAPACRGTAPARRA